jgi:hypothetical protein
MFKLFIMTNIDKEIALCSGTPSHNHFENKKNQAIKELFILRFIM